MEISDYSEPTESQTEEVRLEDVQSSQNVIVFLNSSASSSTTSLSPDNPQRHEPSDSYVHACASVHESYEQIPEERPNGKNSISSDSRQIKILKRSFRNLQVCVVLLCVLIVALMAVDVADMFKSRSHGCSDNFTETRDGLQTLKHCTKCDSLEAKLGLADGFIENIRSTEDPSLCCFKMVDQILRLFDKNVEFYVDQGTLKVRQEMGYNLTRQVAIVTSERSLPLAHLYYTNSNTGKKCIYSGGHSGEKILLHNSDTMGQDDDILSFQTRGIGILIAGGMKVLDFKYLQIPDAGYYFVYSHLLFKQGNAVYDNVRRNDTVASMKILMRQLNGPPSCPFCKVSSTSKGAILCLFWLNRVVCKLQSQKTTSVCSSFNNRELYEE